MLARTCGIIVALNLSTHILLHYCLRLTILWGSFPQEYILANSSPVMVRHQRVCFMLSFFTATLIQSPSNPMSRKHSSAAIFVIWALGVSAVLGVEASISPFKPANCQRPIFGISWEYIPCCTKKHASEAPAGPAPMIKRSISMILSLFISMLGPLFFVCVCVILYEYSLDFVFAKDWRTQEVNDKNISKHHE